MECNELELFGDSIDQVYNKDEDENAGEDEDDSGDNDDGKCVAV